MTVVWAWSRVSAVCTVGLYGGRGLRLWYGRGVVDVAAALVACMVPGRAGARFRPFCAACEQQKRIGSAADSSLAGPEIPSRLEAELDAAARPVPPRQSRVKLGTNVQA